MFVDIRKLSPARLLAEQIKRGTGMVRVEESKAFNSIRKAINETDDTARS